MVKKDIDRGFGRFFMGAITGITMATVGGLISIPLIAIPILAGLYIIGIIIAEKVSPN